MLLCDNRASAFETWLDCIDCFSNASRRDVSNTCTAFSCLVSIIGALAGAYLKDSYMHAGTAPPFRRSGLRAERDASLVKKVVCISGDEAILNARTACSSQRVKASQCLNLKLS